MSTNNNAREYATLHPLYNVWRSFRDRVNRSNHPEYKNYGGRGIDYDPRWDDFWTFLDDVEHLYAPGLSIDRIDNSQGYWPNNVRFCSAADQARNRRTNIHVRLGEQVMCLKDAAERLGVNPKTLKRRLMKQPLTISLAA